MWGRLLAEACGRVWQRRAVCLATEREKIRFGLNEIGVNGHDKSRCRLGDLTLLVSPSVVLPAWLCGVKDSSLDLIGLSIHQS